MGSKGVRHGIHFYHARALSIITVEPRYPAHPRSAATCAYRSRRRRPIPPFEAYKLSKVFNPCVVIPVYNHHLVIDSLVERIRQFGLACFLVDDGSDSECRRVLQRVAATDPRVRLMRLETNSGKGAAVCAGLEAAARAGHSHALQIDADGQHNSDDIPRFIACARQHPGAVVSGLRIYGEVPASRRYGRKLTDGLVYLHTLSLAIRDSMCGYRVYPLPATMQLLQRCKVGQRMDFDTDILVRLYWEGVAVEHVATPVVYHCDIPSHFNLLSDNLRMSGLHLRLFLGMLARIPSLLALNRQRPRADVQY